MDRRQLLRHAAFFTVAAATGASSAAGASPLAETDTEREPARRGRHAFAQGVASGDPKPHSIVFWTR